MKKYTRLLSCLLCFVLLLANLAPAVDLQAQATPNQLNASNSVYLPLVGAPAGPPDFVIINPAPGLTVSGTTLFAIQPLEPQDVARVAFQAGSLSLGIDTTAADGFQTFLDASQLPAGVTQLTATATGPTGKTVTKSISVTVVSKPPASATVGASGATLATASGNTIVVPDGAVTSATINVQDKTQAQVTAEKGINWDALGVTFLGAIDVQASTALSKPLGVSSVGFGNRIQPGQAVVTYRILPDADGDGAGELAVVNGANLAPNGTIVSSAVPAITIQQAFVEAANVTPLASAAVNSLQGAPGAMIVIEGNGFNPLSLQGNVASFRSAVNGQTVRIPANVEVNADGVGQTLRVLIPVLPAGAATLTLRNESTGDVSDPIDVTVSAPPALSRPANELIDAFFVTYLDYLNTISATTPETQANRQRMIAEATKLRTAFQQAKDNPTPEIQKLISDLATIIDGSQVLVTTDQAKHLMSALTIACLTSHQKNQLNLFIAIVGIIGGAGCALAFTGAGAVFCGAGIATLAAVDAYLIAEEPDCPAQPPVCTPAPASSGAGTTGMGAAPPPGGNGCGNAGGGAGSLVSSASLPQVEAGRYTVRVFPRNGGRALSPFTGASDPGGYFFIPLIPQNEPFRAVATDQATGASTIVTGTGPATGKSVVMYFNFDGVAGNRYPIQIGDTISNGVPGPGAGNLEQAGGVDIYTFSGTAGQQVFFDLFDVAASLAVVNWKLTAPDGTVLFDTILNCCGGSDPGVYTLPQNGVYTLRVGDDSDPGTGLYGFTLWNVPPPHRFTISVGDTISNGVPGPGAGNLESPGVKDIYTFAGSSGQQLFFDLFNVAGALAVVNWKLTAPDGATLFDTILNCCGGSDPGVYTLAQSGVYTITVGDDRDSSTGPYAFTVWNVPPTQQFAIAVGDSVSPGVPSAGAGVIESPGVKDSYTFNGTANQQVFFDLFNVAEALAIINWQLTAPDGAVLFDNILNCCGGSDPGVITLPQTGAYTILVGDNRDQGVGVYSFKLSNVPAPDQFNIAIGDTVSNGVPGAGAGNLESPGVRDRYLFTAGAGQQVYFDLINVAASLAQVNWQLTAPDGTVLFDRILNCCGGSDPGVVTLPQAGVYTITVGDDRDQNTGTYGFQIRLP